MNDQVLVRQVLNGNRRAFQKLIRDHERLVSHMVGRIVNQKEAHEELCADVFMKVHEQLHTFRFDAKLSTWIATIAYRLSVNHARKLNLFVDDPAASERYFKAEPFTGHTPESALESDEKHALVREMINHLPISYKTVLTLFYLEEMSYAEIVEITGMPEGTVKSYLNRGRNLLKEKLENFYKIENQTP